MAEGHQPYTIRKIKKKPKQDQSTQCNLIPKQRTVRVQTNQKYFQQLGSDKVCQTAIRPYLPPLVLSPRQVILEIIETSSRVRNFTTELSPISIAKDMSASTPERIGKQIDGFIKNIDVSSLFHNLHEHVQGQSNELKKAIDDLSIKMNKIDVSLDTNLRKISSTQPSSVERYRPSLRIKQVGTDISL